MTQTVNIYDAKTHLSRLLDCVAAGEEVVIARAGTPIARLVPMQSPAPRQPGLFRGVEVPESAFDRLPEEELAAWE